MDRIRNPFSPGTGTPTGSVTDPTGPSVGSERVIRGGSFCDAAGDVRAAYRRAYSPQGSNYCLGFRPARSLP